MQGDLMRGKYCYRWQLAHKKVRGTLYLLVVHYALLDLVVIVVEAHYAAATEERNFPHGSSNTTADIHHLHDQSLSSRNCTPCSQSCSRQNQDSRLHRQITHARLVLRPQAQSQSQEMFMSLQAAHMGFPLQPVRKVEARTPTVLIHVCTKVIVHVDLNLCRTQRAEIE